MFTILSLAGGTALPWPSRKLGQALEALGIDHDVKEYPQAGHAFINDHRREGPWSVL